ncbi:MAG TPA: hypothetical protein VGL86_06655 [Polyangia bacterium]
MGDSLHRLGSIGDRPDDSPSERLRHRFLVYMGRAATSTRSAASLTFF